MKVLIASMLLASACGGPSVNAVAETPTATTKRTPAVAPSGGVDNTVIQVAAESTKADPVPYQAMVAAMDVALKVGFSDVKITDPNGLSARPHM